MREIRTSGLTSGDGKRGVATWLKPPRPSSTLQINGKKRHVLVDTQGLLLCAIVHAADIQDRDGGVMLMSALFGLYPFLLKLYADSGYQGPKFQQGLKRVRDQINVEIVKRSDLGKFIVLPRRWIVLRCTILSGWVLSGRPWSLARTWLVPVGTRSLRFG